MTATIDQLEESHRTMGLAVRGPPDEEHIFEPFEFDDAFNR